MKPEEKLYKPLREWLIKNMHFEEECVKVGTTVGDVRFDVLASERKRKGSTYHSFEVKGKRGLSDSLLGQLVRQSAYCDKVYAVIYENDYKDEETILKPPLRNLGYGLLTYTTIRRRPEFTKILGARPQNPTYKRKLERCLAGPEQEPKNRILKVTKENEEYVFSKAISSPYGRWDYHKLSLKSNLEGARVFFMDERRRIVGEAVVISVVKHGKGEKCLAWRNGRCRLYAVFAHRPWRYNVPVTQKDLDDHDVPVRIKTREEVTPSSAQMITYIAVKKAHDTKSERKVV